MVKAKQIKLRREKGATGFHYEDYKHIDYSKLPQEEKNYVAFNSSLAMYNDILEKMKLDPKNVAFNRAKDHCNNLIDNKVYNTQQYESCICGIKTGYYGKKVAKKSPECEVKTKKVK